MEKLLHVVENVVDFIYSQDLGDATWAWLEVFFKGILDALK